MPTYEYRCPEGHEFEHFVRNISEGAAELACPTCGKMAQRKMSGGGGLLFKGSGFYITDYGKDGKKDQRRGDTRPASAEKSSEKTAGSGGDAKPSDAKPSDSSGAAKETKSSEKKSTE